MTTNQDGLNDDDFAMKFWLGDIEEFDPVWVGTDKFAADAIEQGALGHD